LRNPCHAEELSEMLTKSFDSDFGQELMQLIVSFSGPCPLRLR